MHKKELGQLNEWLIESHLIFWLLLVQPFPFISHSLSLSLSHIHTFILSPLYPHILRIWKLLFFCVIDTPSFSSTPWTHCDPNISEKFKFLFFFWQIFLSTFDKQNRQKPMSDYDRMREHIHIFELVEHFLLRKNDRCEKKAFEWRFRVRKVKWVRAWANWKRRRTENEQITINIQKKERISTPVCSRIGLKLQDSEYEITKKKQKRNVWGLFKNVKWFGFIGICS